MMILKIIASRLGAMTVGLKVFMLENALLLRLSAMQTIPIMFQTFWWSYREIGESEKLQ